MDASFDIALTPLSEGYDLVDHKAVYINVIVVITLI